MIHSKNHKRGGFTLIEVMFAVMIVGLLLIPLLGSQSNIMNRLFLFSGELQRIFSLAFFLQDTATQNAGEPVTEKVHETSDEPPAQLTFEEKNLAGDKRFKKFPHMYLQKATAMWNDDGRKRSEALVSFVFRAGEEDEKK